MHYSKCSLKLVFERVIYILKARKVDDGIGLYDPQGRENINVTFSPTTWEIIKAIKKYGAEKAVNKIMNLFDIDEKNAREDIKTVLTNLNTLHIDIDKIPLEVSEKKFAPRTFQIDITPRCNSKCLYCLSSDLMSHSEEMTTNQIIDAIKKAYDLEMYSLTISGGEPFLRDDLFEILDFVNKYGVTTWIFSNGMLITEDIAKKLGSYKNVNIQISLDSSKSNNHDFQRGGKGFFKKTEAGIKNLIKYGKTPTIATILTPYNFDDLEDTTEYLYKLGINSIRVGTVWVNTGKAKENRERLYLDFEKTKLIGNRLLKLIDKYKNKINFSASPKMFNYSKNPELVSGLILGCDAGIENLYVASNGDVYPCYALAFPDFKAGNIKEDDISELWNKSDVFKIFRNLSTKDFDKCKTCKMISHCEGGCRGNAFFKYGSLKAHDPIRCSYFLNDFKPDE